MDEELTLHELKRLEAERKLRSIPADILDTAWVRDAQIEAVIDAVLAVQYSRKPLAYAHARHVGEWCARIAEKLAKGPNPVIARRVGVLANVDAEAISQLPELQSLSIHVRDYQTATNDDELQRSIMSTIVSVADDFVRRLSNFEEGRGQLPRPSRECTAHQSDTAARIVNKALCDALYRGRMLADHSQQHQSML